MNVNSFFKGPDYEDSPNVGKYKRFFRDSKIFNEKFEPGFLNVYVRPRDCFESNRFFWKQHIF